MEEVFPDATNKCDSQPLYLFVILKKEKREKKMEDGRRKM
jgi:hypothetical protein